MLLQGIKDLWVGRLNYLASHGGQRCVIFLDELDKTKQEVRESLLTILDTG